MLTTNALAVLGALVGDPTRAGMLVALMDGRALTAGELASLAGVTPQTASSHLSRLVIAGMLSVERQGRHRYHRLASPEVARMMEGMMAVAAPDRTAGRPVRTGPRDAAMRQARTCYDHLAGRVAVAIADSLVGGGHVEFCTDGGELTRSGVLLLAGFGIDVDRLQSRGRRRVLCRPCLDWSERRPHIAGAVGAAMLGLMMERHWLRQVSESRAVVVTPPGQRRLSEFFGLPPSLWQEVGGRSRRVASDWEAELQNGEHTPVHRGAASARSGVPGCGNRHGGAS